VCGQGAHTCRLVDGAEIRELKPGSHVRSSSAPSVALNTKAFPRAPRRSQRRAGPRRGEVAGGGGGDARNTASVVAFVKLRPRRIKHPPSRIFSSRRLALGRGGLGGARLTSGGGACSSAGTSVSGSAMLQSRRGSGVMEM